MAQAEASSVLTRGAGRGEAGWGLGSSSPAQEVEPAPGQSGRQPQGCREFTEGNFLLLLLLKSSAHESGCQFACLAVSRSLTRARSRSGQAA